jgi:transposase
VIRSVERSRWGLLSKCLPAGVSAGLAVESAGGLGYLLAQQLVSAGKTVLDVPATLALRARLLSTGRSNNNDPNDAHSVAVAALRSRTLRRVEAVGHSEVLRLLAKRNTDIGNHQEVTVLGSVGTGRPWDDHGRRRRGADAVT